MRLIIHAGIHRTGSTALQYFLANNRSELALQGFAYPFDQPHHQQIAWALHRRRMTGQGLLKRLEPLSRSTAHTIVLSGEDFSIHRKLRWLQAVSETYDEVRCVFYLRRQDDWLMSWYNQHIKWPFDKTKSTLSPQEFLATIDDYYWLDYDSLLERWAQTLGEPAITVAVVEKDQVTDVVGHFSQAIGIDTSGVTLDNGRRNDSLPVHLLEIARNFALFQLQPRERLTLNAALRSALKDWATDSTTVYSPEERLAVLERFVQSNRAVARRFFGRDDLFLAPPPKHDDPYFTFPATSREELLRDWVAPVIRELVRNATK
ncbi:MAG: hypothetical protein ACRD2Z_12200 [Thermoanaerobaculia bacterium]